MTIIAETAYSADRQNELWLWARKLADEGWNVSIIDAKNASGQVVTRLEAKK